MKKLGYKLAAGATSAAMLAATMAPPVFADSLSIVRNGAGSNNAINVHESCVSLLKQKNKTGVEVEANLGSNTGENHANRNTGAGVDVDSGDAVTDAFVTVQVGGNVAEDTTDCCECLGSEDTTETIRRNGAGSRNRINTSRSILNSRTQKNRNWVGVGALLRSRTGGNTANRNTGGSISVDSGHADSFFDVLVRTRRNILR